jgi:hypothetical protein
VAGVLGVNGVSCSGEIESWEWAEVLLDAEPSDIARFMPNSWDMLLVDKFLIPQAQLDCWRVGLIDDDLHPTKLAELVYEIRNRRTAA